MQPSLTASAKPDDTIAPSLLASTAPLPELPAPEAVAAQPPQEPPEEETHAQAKAVTLPKALMDDIYREARKNFILIPDMTFALKIAARNIRDTWDHKDGKFTRKELPFANYVPPKDEDPHTPPTPKPKPGTPTVAQARAKWDAAKREGDADAMTRTANDLLRAVEAERAAQSGIPESASSIGELLSASVREYAQAPGSGQPERLTRLGSDQPEPSAALEGAAITDGSASDLGRSDSSDEPAAPNLQFTSAASKPQGAGIGATLAVSAQVTALGTLADVQVEMPDWQSWGPTNRQAAGAIASRIVVVGKAIQDFGSDDEKEAWKKIKKIILDDNDLGGAVALNDNDLLLVDVSRLAPGADPTKKPSANFVLFVLMHEILHSSKSDRLAQAEAKKMQGGKFHKIPPPGSPQWSAEVRLDKRVYDLLVKAGILDPHDLTSIKELAPYYAEHLAKPSSPVLPLPVPGYDGPIQ